MTLSLDEVSAIKSCGIDIKDISNIERRSDDEFDFGFSYVSPDGWNTSAWLPLAVIRSSDWIFLASFSDYPEMVLHGDWSGIRDSSKESIWEMFHTIFN